MKTAYIPAQITTIEDKIIGNISIQQAAIVCVPSLLGCLTTNLLPSSGQMYTYKLIINLTTFITSLALAIRIKDKMVIQWLRLLIKYYKRPLRYVCNKNTTHHREMYNIANISTNKINPRIIQTSSRFILNIPQKELIRLDGVVTSNIQRIKIRVNKKGELNVRIPKIK